jgi:hypothetical protein
LAQAVSCRETKSHGLAQAVSCRQTRNSRGVAQAVSCRQTKNSRGVAQAVSCWLLTAEARIKSRPFNYEICGGQRGAGIGS